MKPSGAYVTLLLDDDRLMVSANGYLYCLDPSNGAQLWNNETKGFGTGVASIASFRGNSSQNANSQAAQQAAQQQAAAAAAS
ncbi:MAG: hypothetical protein EXS05_14375 [Planctomycetaceae bacterium]|nr:hypothetical protein [Planctomycetaceae bacterium]